MKKNKTMKKTITLFIMKSKLLLLMLLIGSMCFAQAPTDYYAYYPFTNGSIVNQANPGTGDIASGSYTFTTDRFGNSNSAMDCENVRANGFSNPNAMNEFAVSFWVKMDVLPNSSTTGTQRVIDFYENAANGDYVFFNRTAPDDFEIVYQINGQTTSHTFSSTALQTGQWCHVVLQSDRLLNGSGVIDNQLQFFFNGNFETVISSNLNLLNSGAAFANGGVLSISRASNFPGLIDDIQLFDRKLSNQEVSDIYNASTCASIVNIPDTNFKNALLAHGTTITGVGISVIDTDGDGEICDVEAQAYTGTIDVPFKNISDLTGIEAFINTSILYVNNNQLTSLDVSNNLSLVTIYFNNNNITQADLSLNTNLTRVYAFNNQLTSLNVANGNNSNFTAMRAQGNANACIQHDTNFSPNNNWIRDTSASWSTNCSASACTSLVNIPNTNFKNALLAHGTTITGVGISIIDTDGDGEICTTEAIAYTGTINVSSQNISDLTGIEAFTALTVFRCHDNSSLTSLDVSQNTALIRLDCYSNNLTSLDVSQNTTLNELLCGSNSLTSLNVANGNNGNMAYMQAQNNPNLTCIQHDAGFDPTTNNNWTKDATASWSDNCSTSACTSIVNIPDANFKNALLAHGITITGTGHSVIDTDGDGEICTTEAQAYTGNISVSSRSISDLTGIEAFINIQELRCFNNTLTSIDISANTSLSWLSADNNQLTSANLANGNNYTILSVVNVSNNTNLSCVQHDTGFDPTTNNNWTKDATASWSDDCQYTILVSAITVQGQNGVSTITTNGGTLQMEASVAPFNVTDATYTWSVTNGTGSATIDATGVLTAMADGTVDVIATANDGSGVTGSKTITISNQSVGINDLAFESISLYPNPTNDVINIELKENLTSIQLFDITGKRIRIFNSQSRQLDVSDIKAGIYFLEISNNEKQSIQKIIIK